MLTDYTSAMFNRPFKADGARSAGLPARFGGSMNSSGTIIHIPDCPPNPAEPVHAGAYRLISSLCLTAHSKRAGRPARRTPASARKTMMTLTGYTPAMFNRPV